MKIPQNLGSKARLGYVIFGVALVGLAVLGFAPGKLWPWLVIVGGGVIALEGAVGF